jgi:hypothetical protein
MVNIFNHIFLIYSEKLCELSPKFKNKEEMSPLITSFKNQLEVLDNALR